MGMWYLYGPGLFRLALKGKRQRLKKISQKILTRRLAPSWLAPSRLGGRRF